MHLDREQTATRLGVIAETSMETLRAEALRRAGATVSDTGSRGGGDRRPGRAGRGPGSRKPATEIRATVLVADDEEMVLRVMRRLLERQGMRVLTAIDGEHALEVFVENQDEIDAVILDIVMPKLDGIATLQELRSMDPAVKILLSSGYPERKVPESTPPVNFLRKPCRANDLALKLDEMLSTEPN